MEVLFIPEDYQVDIKMEALPQATVLHSSLKIMCKSPQLPSNISLVLPKNSFATAPRMHKSITASPQLPKNI